MKALIICISVHKGNTKKIAEAIAEVLGAKIVKPKEINPGTLKNYDLIGFGSGIYFGNYHKKLLRLIRKLPKMKGKRAFIFSTSGMPRISLLHDFNQEIIERLKGRSFQIIGEFNCRGWDTYPFIVKPFGGINKGRPNEKDLKEARKFARRLKEKIKKKS